MPLDALMMGIMAALRRPMGALCSPDLACDMPRPISRGIAHNATRLIPRGLKGPPAGLIAGSYAQKAPKGPVCVVFFGGPFKNSCKS